MEKLIMRIPKKVSMANRKAEVTQNVPLGHIQLCNCHQH